MFNRGSFALRLIGVLLLVGLIIGGVNFSELSVTLKQAVGDTAAVTINYGLFLQTVIDFVIIAFAIFMFVKAINALKKKEEVAPPAAPLPSVEQSLLAEIRDLLRAKG